MPWPDPQDEHPAPEPRQQLRRLLEVARAAHPDSPMTSLEEQMQGREARTRHG